MKKHHYGLNRFKVALFTLLVLVTAGIMPLWQSWLTWAHVRALCSSPGFAFVAFVAFVVVLVKTAGGTGRHA